MGVGMGSSGEKPFQVFPHKCAISIQLKNSSAGISSSATLKIGFLFGVYLKPRFTSQSGGCRTLSRRSRSLPTQNVAEFLLRFLIPFHSWLHQHLIRKHIRDGMFRTFCGERETRKASQSETRDLIQLRAPRRCVGIETESRLPNMRDVERFDVVSQADWFAVICCERSRLSKS